LLTGAWAWAEAISGTSISLAYLVPDLAFITVLMTAAYMTRQFSMGFLSAFRGVVKSSSKSAMVKISETSLLIKIPLIILALLSLGFAFSLNPFSTSAAWLLDGISHRSMVAVQFIDVNVHEMLQVVISKYDELH